MWQQLCACYLSGLSSKRQFKTGFALKLEDYNIQSAGGFCQAALHTHTDSNAVRDRGGFTTCCGRVLWWSVVVVCCGGVF